MNIDGENERASMMLTYTSIMRLYLDHIVHRNVYQASKSGHFLMARPARPGPTWPDTAYKYISFKKYSCDGSQQLFS